MLNNIPQHVAIIMDGNGRWAKMRGLPRSAGHGAGIKRIREITEEASNIGLKVLTLFAFSAENWQRPKEEVDALMNYLDDYLKNNLNELMEGNVVLRVIGRAEPLPAKILKRIDEVTEKTRYNNGLVLNLALNYGSRQEIVDGVKNIALLISKDELKVKDIDENLFSQFLYTKDIPDPDLLIRTSGEQRISNFLLWQISYSELYFTNKYWPDFTKEDFKKAIREYQGRSRRFGALNYE